MYVGNYQGCIRIVANPLDVDTIFSMATISGGNCVAIDNSGVDSPT